MNYVKEVVVKTQHIVLTALISSLVTTLMIVAIFGLTGTTQADHNPLMESSISASGRSQVFDYNTSALASTSYFNVIGYAFRTVYDGVGLPPTTYGCTYLSNNLAPGLYYPLELPNGSVITAIRYYYYDISITENGTLTLVRQQANQDPTVLVTNVPAAYIGYGYHDETGLSIVTDYENYSYTLAWSEPTYNGSIRLCGARVTYTPPSIFGSALPLVEK